MNPLFLIIESVDRPAIAEVKFLSTRREIKKEHLPE